MMATTRILLSTQEEAFVKEVDSILNARRTAKLEGVCKGLTELKASLEHAPVSIALIDIDSDPKASLKELDRIVPLYPETRFAVASSSSNKELILEAMQAGVRDFIHKNSLEAEIDRILEHLLFGGAKSGQSLGNVITVLQASGGCGATTVAINLANELRLKTSEPVLTMDLDSSFGALSAYLGITKGYGIADVLKRTGQIDRNLITSSATNYRNDYDVLISPASMEHFAYSSYSYPNLIDAIEACKEAYKHTVIDAPRLSEDLVKTLITVSKTLLVVFEPSVKDIKTARSIITNLVKLGARSKSIIPLVNRFQRRGPVIPLEETKKALKLDSISCIRSDFKRVANCINRGEPLAELAPRSSIRKDFLKLTETVCELQKNGNGAISERVFNGQ